MSNQIESPIEKIFQAAIANPELVTNFLKALLEAANIGETLPFTTESLKIGARSKADLLNQLSRDGVWLSDFVRKLVNDPNFQLSTEQTIQVAVVTGKDLGLNEHFTYPQLVAILQRHGLELVPQDTAFYCRSENGVTVASETIANTNGDPRLLYVGNYSGVSIMGNSFAGPKDGHGPDNRFLVKVSQQV